MCIEMIVIPILADAHSTMVPWFFIIQVLISLYGPWGSDRWPKLTPHIMGTAMQVLYMKFWDFIGAEAAVNLLSQKNQSTVHVCL